MLHFRREDEPNMVQSRDSFAMQIYQGYLWRAQEFLWHLQDAFMPTENKWEMAVVGSTTSKYWLRTAGKNTLFDSAAEHIHVRQPSCSNRDFSEVFVKKRPLAHEWKRKRRFNAHCALELRLIRRQK